MKPAVSPRSSAHALGINFMMALFAMMTMMAFLGGTGGYYWLRDQARKAGLSVAVFTNTDAWPQINRMIADAQPDQQRKLRRVARSVQVCMVLTFLGFAGLVLFGAFQAFQ